MTTPPAGEEVPAMTAACRLNTLFPLFAKAGCAGGWMPFEVHQTCQSQDLKPPSKLGFNTFPFCNGCFVLSRKK